jgi:L-fuculose-phosphate aldolase
MLCRERAWGGAASAVVAAARRLSEIGLVSGTVGNVSARVNGGMVITPSRTPYGSMSASDAVFVAVDGTASGRLAPSTEWPLHLAVYSSRPDAGAVVHTHSLHATAWSFRGCDVPLPELEELRYYGIGRVAVSSPATAGTADLGAQALLALGGSGRAALLGEHGVVTLGSSVDDAVVAAEVVERQATIAWLLEGSRVLTP